MALPLAFGAILMAVATSLVVRVLFSFGVGITTYVGMDYFIDEAQSQVMAKYGQLPDFAFQLASLAGVDECIKILFAAASAYVAVRVMMGVYKKLGFVD